MNVSRGEEHASVYRAAQPEKESGGCMKGRKEWRLKEDLDHGCCIMDA